MSEVMSEMREALCKELEPALTDEIVQRAAKKLRNEVDSLVENFHYELQGNLAEHLSYFVKDMASRAVNALLEGNESEMERWLSCGSHAHTGRSDGAYNRRSIEEQHPIIHGKLFEQGCLLLRKRITEAHRELLASQRILDLEDQVRSLVAQNNKMERERNEWREKALEYTR